VIITIPHQNPDYGAVTANLTGLFFTLRERPDGIVRVG